MAHEQEFHPDRFTQLHNSIHEAVKELFGLHRESLEKRLDKLERMIMTGFAEVEAEVSKVKAAVADLRATIATLSAAGGATSAQLDTVIADLDSAIAPPAPAPVTDPAAPAGSTPAASA